MAPEIADSDAESDIIVQENPIEQDLFSPPATRPTATARDNATQHLSDLDSSARKGTGSTDRLIRELYKPSYDGAGDEETASADLSTLSNNGNKRRAHSDALGTLTSLAEEPAKKRSRTYGAKAREVDLDLFGTTPPQMEQQPLESSPGREDAPLPGDQLMALDNSFPNHVGQRERDRPRRVVSLINATHHVTTSTSSMGGYQSIELNFRGGVDVNTNPFSSLSRISADNAEPQNTEPSASNQLNDMLDHFTTPHIQTRMMTSPIRNNTPSRPTVEPLSEAEEEGIDGLAASEDIGQASTTDMAALKRPRTDAPVLSATETPAQTKRAASIAVESASNSSTSKPGRPKSKKQTEDVDFAPYEEPTTVMMGPPPLDEHQTTHHSHVNTTEHSSQASQSSQLASKTKKKRKKTNTDVKVTEEPKKLPSSELGLNDESVIGLPKEQYKPRPSRSRSKRLVDQDEMSVEIETPSKDFEESVTTTAPPETPASNPSTGKSRKKKVKRAKTSAAALLKPSAPMLSDGEEDVVWMDTKPASVKLNLPPDLKVLKKEVSDSKGDISEDELQRNETYDRFGNGTVVSIEIPLSRDQGEAQSDGASDNKPKKKRGRPKKDEKEKEGESSAAQVSVQPEAANPREPVKEDRPALASKDPNTSKSQPKGKAKSKAIITDSDDEDKNADAAHAQDHGKAAPTLPRPLIAADKENADTTAQPPAISPNTKSAVGTTPEKKPTHSPLKPTPLSSSSSSSLLARHRVGLSRRSKIPSLLRKVDRHKPPPTKTGVKVKELKIKGVNDGGVGDRGDGDGGDGDGEGSGRACCGIRRGGWLSGISDRNTTQEDS